MNDPNLDISLDISKICDEDIIQACNKLKAPGSRIVQLSKTVIVKYGIGVTAGEAAMQRYIWKHADCKIFCVPKVLRFFTDTAPRQRGYLVMENIHGPTLEVYLETVISREVTEREVALKISRAIAYLSRIPLPESWSPGPLERGIPQGYIFSDSGADRSFDSISEIETWCSQRLKVFPRLQPKAPIISTNVSFDPKSFKFCHTDLAPRNVIMADNGSLYLIDWAFAGIYPSIFEIYALRTRSAFDPILSLIMGYLPVQSVEDGHQLQLLGRVQYVQTACGESFAVQRSKCSTSSNQESTRLAPPPPTLF